MRLLHTSDWHLGRTLHGADLLGHQAVFCDHLVEVVRTARVDAVVVAGDVYDRAVPPVEAVELLSATLARLAELCTVVLTSGNHDSATRLGFASGVMTDRVRLRTRVADLATPVELVGDGRPVLVYGLPYLDPDTVRVELASPGPDGAAVVPGRSHQAVLTAAMERVRADAARRSRGAAVVVAAHAFVGGQRLVSDSERDLSVGGVAQVPASVLAGVDYAALGHLHSAQVVDVGGSTVARYSGSPLAYSFDERVPKSSVLVEVGGGVLGDGASAVGTAGVRTELVPAPVPRPLSTVRGTLAEVLGAPGEPYREHWTKVVVTDAGRPPDLLRRVRASFPHALVVSHVPESLPEQRGPAEVTGARVDPLAVVAQFVEHVTGAAPDAAELTVLRRAYDDVLAAERSA